MINYNIDLSNNYINLTDSETGQSIGSTINNTLNDFGVRTDGTVDGYIAGDIDANFPVLEVERLSAPLFYTHKARHKNAVHAIIVGSGGTGGYVVRDIARYMYSLINKGDSRRFKITLVDGDMVEEKNLVRQNFIMRDISQPKAEVLAKRYSAAFGVEIEPVIEMADKRLISKIIDDFNNELSPITRRSREYATTIVIGCVDNNQARRSIRDGIRRKNETYWVDSGNERSSGQVICGLTGIDQNTHAGMSPEDVWLEHNTQFAMPFITDVYREVADSSQDHGGDDGLSCAERAQVEEQNIFVNMTAAVHVTNFVRQIIAQEPMPAFGVEFNIKGVNNVRYNTKKEFFDISQ